MESKGLLRLLDANYNRAKEALRVSEDVLRFHLSDRALAGRAKRLRHEITRILLSFPVPYAKIVASRDSAKDVGRGSGLKDKKRITLEDLFVSNMKRSCEAVRVLEEVSKILRPEKTSSFERVRFGLYELEKSGLKKF